MNEGNKIREKGLRLWKRERNEQNLTSIELDFFQKMRIYLNHLEKTADEDSDIVVRKIFRKLFTRTSYVVNDLITLRLQKILKLVIANAFVTEKLNEEELKTYNFLKGRIDGHRERILKGTKSSQPENISISENFPNHTKLPKVDKKLIFEETPEISYCLVLFVENEDEQTLGSDLKTYGPFQKDMYAIIPVDNALEYQRRKKVEIVFVNP